MDPKILELTKEWFQFGEKDLKAAVKLSGEFNSITASTANNRLRSILKVTNIPSDYAVETRYPGNYPSITDEETTKAIEYAKLLKHFILSLAEENGLIL